MAATVDPEIHDHLQQGIAIPASPLALDENRSLDEKHQKAIYRYYASSGVGGIAVGVHTTQFEIRKPEHGLFKPVLELASEEMSRLDQNRKSPLVRVAGVCGKTEQALSEAETASGLGYHAGLLSLSAMKDADDDKLISHCRSVAEVIPVIGFYLQPKIGGRVLDYGFWRKFFEIENVVAVKMAPFNRYQTLDVVRAVIEAGRDDVALYTGNDDNIVIDLLTPFRFDVNGVKKERRIVGGLLGHWSVWTKKAVELLTECKLVVKNQAGIPDEMLRHNVEVTDSNAAFFDAANAFSGCIPGIHEVLRRQGLLKGLWCLDPDEKLSPGQKEEIDRVYKAYPHLNDDAFVAENLSEWLKD